MPDAKKMINSQLNESRISPTDYQSCEVVRMTDDYVGFVNNVNASAANRGNLTNEYNRALEEAQETYDKQLVQEAAAGEFLTEALVIISSGGAATPIVIASYVVGGSCAAYSVSNMIEGGQDIYYGSQGDASTIAVNPIRDTIF